MDDLAKFQERIKENQAKLDELEAARNALKEETRKRKLEEEREKIKKQEEAAVKRKRLKLSMSKPRAEIRTEFKIRSLKLLEQEDVSEAWPFRQINGNSLLLCSGSMNGKLQVWDILDSYKCAVTVEAKADAEISCILPLEGQLNLSSKGKDKADVPKKDSSVGTVPRTKYLALSCGCDVVLVSIMNWSVIYLAEDAHESDINCMSVVSVDFSKPNPTKVVVTGGMDYKIKGWDTTTWKCLFVLGGHQDMVLGLEVFPRPQEGDLHSQRLVSCGDDSTMQVWDIMGAWNGSKANSESVFQVAKAEHVIKEHEDFVSVLCVVPVQKDASFLVSCSGDFTMRVWNSKWECVRVLEGDKFVTHIHWQGGILVASTRAGNDFEENSLEMWTVSDPLPVKWQARSKATLRVMNPTDLLAESIDLLKYVPKGASAPPKPVSSIVITSTEEESVLSIWGTPFRVKEGGAKIEQKSKDHVPPESLVSVAGTSKSNQQGIVALPEACGDIDTNLSRYSGDVLAKKFIANVLELPNLSPDMTRLLNVCVNLHRSR
mmetsp:Transcript_34630/g.55352  ORF Transcript_34630/g.55352 Transcript_34630/m.55352 type:complete len:545 (+) Transcript_34630:3706-5340(+)